ncbi:MAG: hypothetical protein ABJE95_14100 [Byssovorax sp.]
MNAGRSRSLLVADEPDRARLRELQATLDALLDAIVGLELALDEARAALVQFERDYEGRLRAERDEMTRVQGVIRQLERWASLLDRFRAAEIAERAARLDAQRDRETQRLEEDRARRDEPRREPAPRSIALASGAADEPASRERDDAKARGDEKLKAVYRALVRRCHPDLAQTEADRVRLGGLMARINGLYAEGDLRRLERLVEQTRDADSDGDEKSTLDRIAEIEARIAWLTVVRDNLTSERATLDRCATGELRGKVEAARGEGRDLLEELRGDLQREARRARGEVRAAVRLLEEAVDRYNKQNALATVKPPSSAGTLERVFDPYDDKRFVRLGLEQLAALHLGPAALREAEWLTELATRSPPLLGLILMTYAAELSPTPLPGLEKYEDIALRFRHFAGGAAITIDDALVELAERVEYGLRRTSARRAHAGLRFRSVLTRQAIPAALRSHAVRRAFKGVLAVLDERLTCPACAHEIFGVPLMRTRGLDDLRSLVCPDCGHTLKSYWMPKGKDVQAVLNDAFLELELVTEWSLRLAQTSVAIQLVDAQLDVMTVGDLKARLFTDIFERNQLGVARDQASLEQAGAPVDEATPLFDLDDRSFTVTFRADASVSVPDAVEILRHRIRTRFQPDPAPKRPSAPPQVDPTGA